MSKKLFAVALLLSIAVVGFAVTPNLAQIQALRQGWAQPVDGGSVLWKQEPTAATGWYWMYDGTCGSAGDVPFTDPIMPSLPTWQDISGSASKLAPYNDRPFAYTLVDSFWYYGHWYTPGDILYISPDGWVSFDPAIQNDGAPTPPTSVPAMPNVAAPNELFAPLWADYNPTLTAEPSTANRVYYIDETVNTMVQGIVVQWNQIKSASGSGVYTFQLSLTTGGQDHLTVAGSCGVMFSRHYIHFIYNSATPNWTGDNARTGIENQGGDYGILYGGTLANNRAIRSGYKKIFKHDVSAYSFLAPGPVVLRWTKTEPQMVVANVGTETEHFTSTVDIYDDNDSLVYHNVLGTFDLLPNARDTVVGPCWTPGEIGASYRKVLHVALANDECKYNDSLEKTSFVHCDDTFRYDWNFGDGPGVGWGIGTDYFLTWYGVDGGVLATGARAYSYDADPTQDKGQLALFKGQTAGCGAPNTTPVMSATAQTHQSGWNKAKFGDFGGWITSGEPGGIFVGLTTSNSNGAGQTGWYEEYGLNSWPASHPCYQGNGPGRGAYLSGTTFYWGANSGDYYTCALEVFVHLGFGPYPLSPMPAPPCYYGEAHDVSAYDITKPNKPYVEAGVALTPEIAIVNIGRQAEPATGFLPVKFMVKRTSDDSLVFVDSSLVAKIGYLADPTDDPDTMYTAINDWTPVGKCDKDKANIGIEYELTGLVRLGEVGPDESDHCPYNDTTRRTVTALLTHDVGVIDLVRSPEPSTPPDIYETGAQVTMTATIENFGYNQEHNVPVKIDVVDKSVSPDTLVWSNSQAITVLDWRGNTLGNPYTADVIFPVFTVPSQNWLTATAKTELPGDMCPDNDIGPILNFHSGAEEMPAGLPYALESATPSGVTFTLPTTVNVSVKIYDISGKLVTTLVSGSQTPGRHEIRWNGTDNAGRTVAKGIYLVRMDSESFNATKKVVVY